MRASAALGGLTLLWLAACGPSADPSWRQEPGYRWRELEVPGGGRPGFAALPPDRTGLAFQNTLSDSLALANRILAQGGGVALGDVDGDGRADVYFCRTDGPNALYLNRGDWRFDEVAAERGVAAPDRHSTGAVFADVDGDGDLDLILLALGGPNALFLNDGTGHFTEQGEESGLASRFGSVTATMADVDGDGDLDLFVANYKAYTTLDRLSPQERAFDQVVHQVSRDSFEVNPPYRTDYRVVARPDLGGITLVQRADPNFLYLNDGQGRFTRVSLASDRFRDEAGRPLLEEPEYFTLAARFADLNDDGHPDLYVANDFEDPDELWLNDGRGVFQLAPRLALRNTSNSSMAVDVGDVNRDGRTDIFVVDMLSHDTRRLKTQAPTHTALPKMPGNIEDRPQRQRNTLFLNRGDGTFAELASLAGVEASGWSWSTMFMDVDLDGWEDLLVGTGHPWDVMDSDVQFQIRNRLTTVDWRRMLTLYPPLPLPNMAFRNRGDLRFEDVTKAWGFAPEDDISHGMASADLDGDGDLDVVVNRLNQPAGVFRNTTSSPRIAVRLRAPLPNTQGVGARVVVHGGAVPLQMRDVSLGGLYLSGADPLLSFATGTADSVTIEVRWPGGGRSVIRGAPANRLFEITPDVPDDPSFRPAVADSARPGEAEPEPFFEDRTADLRQSHQESLYEEYSRQLMLPNNLGRFGPGVAWVDVDRDGDEDLLIATGKGGRVALARNTRGQLGPARPIGDPAAGDITTVLGLPDGQGGMRVLAGQSSYESASMAEAAALPSVLVLEPSRPGAATVAIPGDTSSVGPLTLADYDGDGDLDLFVGGRVIPGAYPRPASSRLFRNEGGRFILDQLNSDLLRGAGLVSAALFTDLDGDGDPDLALALEWGPIRLFLNEGGRFQPAPASWGLDGLQSRWNGLAAGDLDGDGRLDLVATSWGRNVAQAADSAAPLFVYFGNFGARNKVDLVLARMDPRLNSIAPLASFGRFSRAVPEMVMWMRSYADYADATIEQVLGPAARRVERLAATTLDHTVFLNRGNRFEAVPLPLEAQFAPAFYAGVADFDGDGHEDLFLSQNFFATEIGTPRHDAGRGLLLLGDGTGRLSPVAGQRSGLQVYGEQRGAAFSDFDGDGRLDLVVSQNGAATRLFRNQAARPGLRVRLLGPPANPDGIGAQIRVDYGTRTGPVREVQAGSGYWSQNGAVQVMGLAGDPAAIRVRWPGGEETRVAVPPGASEITVAPPGR